VLLDRTDFYLIGVHIPVLVSDGLQLVLPNLATTLALKLREAETG